MPTQNKKTKTKVKAHKLFLLCFGGLVLGSVIPLIAAFEHTGTSDTLLLAMEAIGFGILAYVFSLYILRK